MTYVSYISFLVRMGTPFFPRMGFLSMPKIWLAFLTRASTACLSSRLSWMTYCHALPITSKRVLKVNAPAGQVGWGARNTSPNTFPAVFLRPY